MKIRSRMLTALCAVLMAAHGWSVAARDIPAQLPDPDGKAGDATQPVKVYILAGQSNMVGFGAVGGAQCPYAGVYLTADPAATQGPLSIYRVGDYRIVSHGVYPSDDSNEQGATASLYTGAYDPGRDYDRANPAKSETVALGAAQGTLPTLAVPHIVVVRGYLDVPESGTYTLNPGYGDSTCNVMKLDGKVVYRKDVGGQAVKQKVALEAGRRYPFSITYFKGGSTALWMSQEDLQGKGDLEILTRREKKFPWLINEDGTWTVRNDVYFQEARIAPEGKGSPLSPTSNGAFIGPELGFGYVVGTYHDEQVLLIKTAMGNRALGFDFRPPSSGRTDPDNKWESLEYTLMVEGVRKTLDNLEKVVPGYKGQGCEMTGFVWWQGHKDAGATKEEYEKNLVNLINDVRKEFDAPGMLAVIATVGFGGQNINENYLKILEAQMAVGDPGQHPEYAGTVASVDTRTFWREADESPSNPDYHYNKNAETYMLTGDALGRAMVGLLGGKAEPLPQAARPKHVAQEQAGEPSEEEKAAARVALAPIIMDGITPAYMSDPRNNAALMSEAKGEKPARANQFLRGMMYGLVNCYNAVGVHDYDWRPFGPDLRDMKWDIFSFDPPEIQPKEKGNRYRKVTCPAGMENWFAPDFNAAMAGWRSGWPPFGQLDGKLEPLGSCERGSSCGCGETPKTLWEKEVLMIRGSFDIPPLKDGHRYRLVVGGSNHVNAGEGFALYVNGKLLAESNTGVGKRQGGQPRGGHIFADFRDAFKGGKVAIAVTSFLRYDNRSGVIQPRGHISVWMEEQKIPPVQ